MKKSLLLFTLLAYTTALMPAATITSNIVKKGISAVATMVLIYKAYQLKNTFGIYRTTTKAHDCLSNTDISPETALDTFKKASRQLQKLPYVDKDIKNYLETAALNFKLTTIQDNDCNATTKQNLETIKTATCAILKKQSLLIILMTYAYIELKLYLDNSKTLAQRAYEYISSFCQKKNTQENSEKSV